MKGGGPQLVELPVALLAAPGAGKSERGGLKGGTSGSRRGSLCPTNPAKTQQQKTCHNGQAG
jgi:hypothetical protein